VHPDAPLLVDIDLSILGQAEARFQEYEAQIRREYEWVPEPAFALKRAEILERFLARERIYSTEPFFSKYEKQARANLLGSIRKLRARLTFRPATLDDCGLLAELNHQLIQDEGHRNPMTVPQLEQRMQGFIQGEYRAVIFEDGGEVVRPLLTFRRAVFRCPLVRDWAIPTSPRIRVPASEDSFSSTRRRV